MGILLLGDEDKLYFLRTKTVEDTALSFCRELDALKKIVRIWMWIYVGLNECCEACKGRELSIVELVGCEFEFYWGRKESTASVWRYGCKMWMFAIDLFIFQNYSDFSDVWRSLFACADVLWVGFWERDAIYLNREEILCLVYCRTAFRHGWLCIRAIFGSEIRFLSCQNPSPLEFYKMKAFYSVWILQSLSAIKTCSMKYLWSLLQYRSTSQ